MLACAEVEQLRERLKNSELGRAMALDDLNTKTRHFAGAAAEVERLRGKLAEERVRFNAALDSAADREREATARVRSMREAAAKDKRAFLDTFIRHVESEERSWAHPPGNDGSTACKAILRAVRDPGGEIMCALEAEALPLDTGTAADTGGEASERCNWAGCHCGGLGRKTDFVPMALEDISQLLAEVATFHRWGATRMQGLDRLMRRLDWYRRRARAWKALAKELAEAHREFGPGSGEDAPGAAK